MSDVFRTVDVPWNGKTLVVRRPSGWTEEELRRHFQRLALEFVLENEGMYANRDAFLDAQRAVSRDAAAKAYAWGMPLFNECLRSDLNVKHLLWLVLVQPGQDGGPGPQPWVTLDLMETIWKDTSYRRDDGRPGNRLWDAYNEALADPNPRPPAGTTASPPAAPS
jgi:hypothetical protein